MKVKIILEAKYSLKNNLDKLFNDIDILTFTKFISKINKN